MHKRFVANIVSRVLIASCLIMVVPCAWAMRDDPHSLEVAAFIKTIVFGIIFSAIFLVFFRIKKEDVKRINTKDGLAIVGVSWILLSALGAMPLYLSQVVSSYTDAFFEIASGFTTTGATIFLDVEILPRGILFWRSLTHWLGGMGIIVLYIALLPALGANAFQLYKAEAPGLTVEKVEPRIKETAKNLWAIYFLFSFIETLLLRFGGMSWFDSLCHTFGTMATGGFSTQNASIGGYGPFIQWVITFFMFLAGINFILHYQMLKGRPLSVFKNEEFRWYCCILILTIPFFALVLHFSNLSLSPLREAAFQVVAILTTTGFTTADFDMWPHTLRFLLVVLMIIGGCGGSTGGGMKIVRVFLSIKIAFHSIVQTLFPNAILPIKFNQKPISDRLILAILSYFSIFVFLIFMGTILFTMTESCDIDTAFTASIAALSNIGPGLGRVGPTQNYAWVSPIGKWLLTFLMLAGRLELYSILILFLPQTWRK